VKVAGAPAAAADAPKTEDAKPKKKTPSAKAAKGKKKKPEGDSKYKSHALAGGTSYRFDSDGNPVDAAAKKKAAAKAKKKSSEESSEDQPAEKPACSSEEPCSDKSPDADAL
jgi:hypothetical protein